MSKRPPNANPALREVPCCDWGFTVLPVSQISHMVGLRRSWVAVRGHLEFTSGRTLLLSPQPTAPLLSGGWPSVNAERFTGNGQMLPTNSDRSILVWRMLASVAIESGFAKVRWNLALSDCRKRNWTFGGAGGEPCRNSGSSSPTITN